MNPVQPFRAAAANLAPLFGKSRAPPKHHRCTADSKQGSNRDQRSQLGCRRSGWLTLWRVSRWPQHSGAIRKTLFGLSEFCQRPGVIALVSAVIAQRKVNFRQVRIERERAIERTLNRRQPRRTLIES